MDFPPCWKRIYSNLDQRIGNRTQIGPEYPFGDFSSGAVRSLSSGDMARLLSIPGIGRRMAERMLLDLRRRPKRCYPGDDGPAARRQDGRRCHFGPSKLGVQEGAGREDCEGLAPSDRGGHFGEGIERKPKSTFNRLEKCLANASHPRYRGGDRIKPVCWPWDSAGVD